jgi:hypothetical protein
MSGLRSDSGIVQKRQKFLAHTGDRTTICWSPRPCPGQTIPDITFPNYLFMFHVIETSMYAQLKLCLSVRFADAKMIVMILIVSDESQKHLPLNPVMSFSPKFGKPSRRRGTGT